MGLAQLRPSERKEMKRQGDILIIPRKTKPKGLKRKKDNIVAHGEVTGHKHVVRGDVELFEDANGTLWAVGTDEWSLHHDTHAPITELSGVFEIRRQREYFPDRIRQVAD